MLLVSWVVSSIVLSVFGCVLVFLAVAQDVLLASEC